MAASLSQVTFSDKPKVLEDFRCLWGILESIQPAMDDLLLVNVAGVKRYVEGSLEETLRPLVGKTVVIGRVCGKWNAGELDVHP
jgi:hypothetical protein